MQFPSPQLRHQGASGPVDAGDVPRKVLLVLPLSMRKERWQVGTHEWESAVGGPHRDGCYGN